MSRIISLIGLVMYLSGNLFSQADTLRMEGTISLRGRAQTGNLDQFVINPNFRINAHYGSHRFQLISDYEFLKVEGFTAKNDFWSAFVGQFHTHKRIYPLYVARYGYARSYRIDHFLLTGAGLGVNLLKKDKHPTLEFNAFAGYMDFQFAEDRPLRSWAWATMSRLSFSISQQLTFLWDFQTYHSGSNVGFWGLNNQFLLSVALNQNLSITLSHLTIFNNESSFPIADTNTLMLFGISYHFQ